MAKLGRPIPPEINGFGEEIIKALGVLVIRASHFDNSLASLLGALTRARGPQVWALFHYSVNAKARLDMIRALAKTTIISDDTRAVVMDMLDTAKRLADERNAFVHSEYAIQPHPNPRGPLKTVLVKNTPAGSKKTYTVRPFDADDIWALNERYRETRDQMARVVQRVHEELDEA